MCQLVNLRRLPASSIRPPPTRRSPPRALMPMTEAPVNANPLPAEVVPPLAPTPATWILIDAECPEVVPVAVIVWAPERPTPRTRTSLKEPLELATTEGKWVPLSNTMVTVSPGVKPEPLIVMLDPAAGVWLLTVSVG